MSNSKTATEQVDELKMRLALAAADSMGGFAFAALAVDKLTQAIADELNARAERTCELNPYNDIYYRCSKCGLGIPKTHDGWWFYCPGCGCKVVSE